MRLSELVSRLSPTSFTEVALIIFLITFGSIVLYACVAGRGGAFERARRLPLQPDREGEVQ